MNKEILRLAIPNIISNISVPLLSTVDTALMGRMSELHIGAVGLGAMIFNFVYWNFGFLRMGTTGITAQAFGKGSNPEMAQTLGRALLVALILAVLVLLIQVPLSELSYYLMNTSDSQLGLVSEYFNIRIWAAPATLALYAIMGWFFGMQNAIFPLILTVFINVVNIICSVFFIKVWGMEVDGVAYGTLIAQYSGVALAIVLWFVKYGHLAKEMTEPSVPLISRGFFLLRLAKKPPFLFSLSCCVRNRAIIIGILLPKPISSYNCSTRLNLNSFNVCFINFLGTSSNVVLCSSRLLFNKR